MKITEKEIEYLLNKLPPDQEYYPTTHRRVLPMRPIPYVARVLRRKLNAEMNAIYEKERLENDKR